MHQPPDSQGTRLTGDDKASAAPVTLTRGRLLCDIADEIDAAPRPEWLVKGLIEVGGEVYGMLAALAKAGKSWLALDLIIAISAGVPWLGRYPTTKGTVLIWSAEGGKRTLVRRIEAIARSYGIDDWRNLPIVIVEGGVNFSSTEGLASFYAELRATSPAIAVIDPWYRSASDSDGQLYGNANILGVAQEACQAVNAALFVVHHWNQTGSGSGAQRATGAGHWEWGRFHMSLAAKKPKVTVGATPGWAAELTRSRGGEVGKWKSATSELTLVLEGNSIVESVIRLTRTLAGDPFDLVGPLHYSLRITDAVDKGEGDASPARGRVLEMVSVNPGRCTVSDLFAPAGQFNCGTRTEVSVAVADLTSNGVLLSKPYKHPGAGKLAQRLFLADAC